MSKERILIVEDEALTVLALKPELAELGYEIAGDASTAAQAQIGNRDAPGAQCAIAGRCRTIPVDLSGPITEHDIAQAQSAPDVLGCSIGQIRLTSSAVTRHSIHHRSGRDSYSGSDDSWQTIFTVSEGNTNHASQYDHRKRSEHCDFCAAQRNPENAAQ